MADHWTRAPPQNNYRSYNANYHTTGGGSDMLYRPPSYEELNRRVQQPFDTNEDFPFLPDSSDSKLLPKPHASSTSKSSNKSNKKQRSPPPLPPRGEQSSASPSYSGSKSNKSSTPPSIYSAGGSTFMTQNVAAGLHNSGSLLIGSDNSSSASSSHAGDHSNLPSSRLTTGRIRQASQSPADSSSEGGGCYLMRTNSGNLFISPPQADCSGGQVSSDSPETLRTSVGGGGDITQQGHTNFGTALSRDSAVATTNTNTTTSRGNKRHVNVNTSKFQEKMFEDVPIRLANVQMSYDPSTGVTRPLLYHTDFRSYSALLSKMTSRLSCQMSWRRCSLVLVILLLIALLALGLLILLFVLPYFGLLTGMLPYSSCFLPLMSYSSLTVTPAKRASFLDLSEKPSYSAGVKFNMASPGFVGIDILTPISYGLIGVYGRKHAPPTRFRHDFFKLIDNSVITQQQKATSSPSVIYRLDNSTVGFVEYLEKGDWFLLFANDDKSASKYLKGDYERTTISSLKVVIFKHGPLATGCPSDCLGRGFCSDKQTCECESGYSGYDCSMPICPVVCSGRGRLVDGPECVCDVGWKGSSCQVAESNCQDPSCSNRGVCRSGKCACQQGFGGEDCEMKLCSPECSPERGVCIEGECYCNQNYAGPTCSLKVFDSNGNQVLGDGTPQPEELVSLDPEQQAKEDERKLCQTRCKNGRCIGENESTCRCFPGFNGRFCSLEGCSRNCSGNGRCIMVQMIGSSEHYTCACDRGWKGSDCSTRREKCTGGVDEDGDSLVDCDDPDCCTRALCSRAPTCNTVPNPILELLSLPVLPPNSPFPERVSFLLRGVQRGIPKLPADRDDPMSYLDQKRVAVVAGNVHLAKDKSHLVGVKVTQVSIGTSQSSIHLGYTLSREQGGAFDLLVEGGGVVWLRFEHPSQNLCPQEIAVNVGWNEFKLLDSPVAIQARRNGQCSNEPDFTCSGELVHDHSKVSPSIFTTWQSVKNGAVGDNFPYHSTIVPETNDPIETLPIGDTGFSLYWLGNFARTRLANIVVRMTPDGLDNLPSNLTFVKLRISIEGVVEERLFEAEPSLEYTFGWSGKNRFNSESAGVVKATIQVGYIYGNCTDKPIWVTRSTQLLSPTCAPVSPPFAGWFLSDQHHFDPLNSILYRSDGSVKLFADGLYLRKVIGQPGLRRHLGSCSRCGNNPECRCEGQVDAIRLSRPRSLALDRNGDLVVLDENAILKVSDRKSKLIYDLKPEIDRDSLMDPVDIEVHPTQESVYIADKRGRRIFRVTVSRKTFHLVAGNENSESCSAPELQDNCGDGGSPKDALLIDPKSLTFDRFGSLYVADGHVIRRISNDSKSIETYVGRLDYERNDFESRKSCWKEPVDRRQADQVIDWPIAVAVNPADDTLYIADVSNVIYQVTPDNQIVVVAGRSPNCKTNPNKSELSPENYRFRNIRDIYFSLTGDMFILQSKPAEVLVLPADRLEVKTLTGQQCSQSTGCIPASNRTSPAFIDSAPVSATDLTFSNPTGVVSLPNGDIFIADSFDNAVYVLERNVPQLASNSHYDVYDSDLDQIYRFDAVGNHKSTVSASTGVTLLNFSYHSEGSLQAPLSKVTNPATGYELTFTRTFVDDSFLWVIESNVGGQAFSARVVDATTPMDLFVDSNNRTTYFSYTPETLLLRTVHRPDGHWVSYEYDANTRLVGASTSGATRLVTMETMATDDRGVATSIDSPQGEETIYEVLGDQLTIWDMKDDISKKINQLAPTVWRIVSTDSSGAINYLSLVDSRSSGATGLDGRNWVALNGNMSVEWRRTSPPSSGSTLTSVGQLLRQLRVTNSRSHLSVSTALSSGIAEVNKNRMMSGFIDGSMFYIHQHDRSIVSSVEKQIVLIAHLNRTSMPQRETFFNLQTPDSNSSLLQQSAVQLLFVSYDDADRPMQIKPAHHKFPIVRLSYVSNSRLGRLSSVHFSGVESIWQSNIRGLLKLRTFADARGYQFSYANMSTQLRAVAVVGGKERMTLDYDPISQGLQSIKQENITKFNFRAVQGLEFSRRIILLPNFFEASKKDVEIALDRGLGFTRSFVVGQVKSSATASFSPSSGNLEKIQHSHGSVKFNFSKLAEYTADSFDSQQKVELSLFNSKTSGTLRYAKFSIDGFEILSASVNKDFANIAVGRSTMSFSNKPSEYSQVTVREFGKIEKVLLGNWTILYELDSHGRLAHATIYEPNSRKPLVQSTAFYEIVHQESLETAGQSPWRIARSLWHVLPSNELVAHIYDWNRPSRNSLLKSIKVERSVNNEKPSSFGQSSVFDWSMPGGSLTEVETFKTQLHGVLSSKRLSYKTGSQDQVIEVTGIGAVEYHETGCSSRIGTRKFEYNSLRQLVKVDSTEISYDAFGRVSYIKQGNSKTALIYEGKGSNLLFSAQIESESVKRYHYSPVTGCVDGILNGTQGRLMVVLTDPWCTPVMGLNSDGSQVKFDGIDGSVTFAGQMPDSSSKDDFVVGYHGFVHLKRLGLIFIDQTRPVDTVTGRFLCPDFSQLLADDPLQKSASLSVGRLVASGKGRNDPINLFQFSGPDASRTNFHLLSLDDPRANNFAGSSEAWLAKILAPSSLSLLTDDALLAEQKVTLENGQVGQTLSQHYSQQFGIATRAEMAANLKFSILSGLSASASSTKDRTLWPVFVPPPAMSPIFGHPILSRVALTASYAFGNEEKQAFDLTVSGKAMMSLPSKQYQTLIKLINVIFNSTVVVTKIDQDQTSLVPDMLQYDLYKSSQSVTLHSDLDQLADGQQITCSSRTSFGYNFEVAADCSSNVIVVRTSDSHIFNIHYGVDVKERLF